MDGAMGSGTRAGEFLAIDVAVGIHAPSIICGSMVSVNFTLRSVPLSYRDTAEVARYAPLLPLGTISPIVQVISNPTSSSAPLQLKTQHSPIRVHCAVHTE